MSKYFSHATICKQGHKHASAKEAGRCEELSLMLKAGVITNLKQQPEFVLQRAFKYQGKTIREIKYRADFSYYDVEKKKFIVEDVKGGLATRTEVYMLKKKMLLYIMRDREDFEFFENI